MIPDQFWLFLRTRWMIVGGLIVLVIFVRLGIVAMVARSEDDAKQEVAAWKAANKIDAELLDKYIKALARRAKGEDAREFTNLAVNVFSATQRGAVVSAADIRYYFGPPDFVGGPRRFFYLYARRELPTGKEFDFCVFEFDARDRLSQVGLGTLDGTGVANALAGMRGSPATLPTTRPTIDEWKAFWSQIRRYSRR